MTIDELATLSDSEVRQRLENPGWTAEDAFIMARLRNTNDDTAALVAECTE